MPSTDAGNRLRIAFVGRLTGPKGRLAHRLASEVFKRFPDTRFLVVGGPVTDEIKAGAPPNVEFTGWRSSLDDTFAETDLVFGSGRVALEALKAGVPVYAVGEACRAGYVENQTFMDAARTNFGDCGENSVLDTDVVVKDLERFHGGFRPDTSGLAAQLERYEGERVASAVEQSYLDARIERRLGTCCLPILCYHRVVPETPAEPGPNIHVTTDVMAGHLRQLQRRGMQTITFADLLDDRPLPPRPVILTFDDGYRDNYEHLLPLLERFDARAVIFALGDRNLRTNAWDAAYGGAAQALMNDAELRACHASGRVEIGSHGLTHAHLTRVDAPTLAREVQESKTRLEGVIGAAVRSFAYPYGEWGPRERQAVETAGYAFGIATDQGLPLAHDRYAAARRIVFPATQGFGFYKKSSRWYPAYRRLMGRT
jgi:peptidoglycan/xylan/chitin deacetylase (PgdA/CDA1 family)